MKKLFLLFALLLSAVQLSFADSALTSTEFYKAYLDVPIVKAAADQPNVLSEEAKAYLFDEANPLDVKLALINAVGWEIEGLTAYKDYLNYCIQHFPKSKYGIAPGKRVTQQDVFKHASPEQKAVLVYLSAMSNYFNTAAMSKMVRMAMTTPRTDKQSFMLAIGLVKAQIASDGDWAEIYPTVYDCVNKPRIKDMRPEAIDIVMEYINEYEEYTHK